LGWRILGLDIDPRAQSRAVENAKEFGLDEQVQLGRCLSTAFEERDR